eukprot:10558-Heterococcus_DN1.PRE.2
MHSSTTDVRLSSTSFKCDTPQARVLVVSGHTAAVMKLVAAVAAEQCCYEGCSLVQWHVLQCIAEGCNAQAVQLAG